MFKYDYLNTFASGKSFSILDFKPDDVTIEDIAHSLSYQCRFNGHIPFFYSVAIHCMNVRELAKRNNESFYIQKIAFLHDATEAYLTDLPTPIKNVLPSYRALENKVWRVICKRFDLNPVDLHLIKKYDKQMFDYEVAHLIQGSCMDLPNYIRIGDIKSDKADYLLMAEELYLR